MVEPYLPSGGVEEEEEEDDFEDVELVMRQLAAMKRVRPRESVCLSDPSLSVSASACSFWADTLSRQNCAFPPDNLISPVLPDV